MYAPQLNKATPSRSSCVTGRPARFVVKQIEDLTMPLNEIDKTRLLAETHALKFKDCGGGHVQISGHGILVNYWPLSKKKTVLCKDGEKHTHCSPWDAVQLCLVKAKRGMKPKKPSTNGPVEELLKPARTNPAGLKHLYSGKIPPWEFPTFIRAYSDQLRIDAHRLREQADMNDATAGLSDCEVQQ